MSEITTKPEQESFKFNDSMIKYPKFFAKEADLDYNNNHKKNFNDNSNSPIIKGYLKTLKETISENENLPNFINDHWNTITNTKEITTEQLKKIIAAVQPEKNDDLKTVRNKLLVSAVLKKMYNTPPAEINLESCYARRRANNLVFPDHLNVKTIQDHKNALESDKQGPILDKPMFKMILAIATKSEISKGMMEEQPVEEIKNDDNTKEEKDANKVDEIQLTDQQITEKEIKFFTESPAYTNFVTKEDQEEANDKNEEEKRKKLEEEKKRLEEEEKQKKLEEEKKRLEEEEKRKKLEEEEKRKKLEEEEKRKKLEEGNAKKGEAPTDLINQQKKSTVTDAELQEIKNTMKNEIKEMKQRIEYTNLTIAESNQRHFHNIKSGHQQDIKESEKKIHELSGKLGETDAQISNIYREIHVLNKDVTEKIDNSLKEKPLGFFDHLKNGIWTGIAFATIGFVLAITLQSLVLLPALAAAGVAIGGVGSKISDNIKFDKEELNDNDIPDNSVKKDKNLMHSQKLSSLATIKPNVKENPNNLINHNLKEMIPQEQNQKN